MKGVHVGIMASSHVSGTSGTAVYTSTAFTTVNGMVDVIDEATVTVPVTYRALLIASSQTIGHTGAGSWPRTPSTTDDVAALAYIIVGSPGDVGYGTAAAFRVFLTGPSTGWPTFVAACLLPSGKVLALVRIRISYDLGDGVTLANGYYLVLFGRPGTATGFIPESVSQLTYVATSGTSQAVDFDTVSAKLIRTGSDAASLVLHIEDRKPGAWTLGAITTTIGRAPGSVSDATFQSNLLMFQITPSTLTVLNGTGYAVTPMGNQSSAGINHWNMNVEVDPDTGYFWFALSAAMQPSLGSGFDTITLDAQTLTFALTNTFPVAVAWDPATRTVVKMVTMTSSIASRLSGLGSAAGPSVLALNSHGGTTRMLFVALTTTTSASTTFSFGGQSVVISDASHSHLIAGVYNVTTDTVELLVDVPAADATTLNSTVLGMPFWTGARWVVPMSSTAAFTINEAGGVSDGTLSPSGTFIPTVCGFTFIAPSAEAQPTDGLPTSVTPGQGVWVVSRSALGGGADHLFVSLITDA